MELCCCNPHPLYPFKNVYTETIHAFAPCRCNKCADYIHQCRFMKKACMGPVILPPNLPKAYQHTDLFFSFSNNCRQSNHFLVCMKLAHQMLLFLSYPLPYPQIEINVFLLCMYCMQTSSYKKKKMPNEHFPCCSSSSYARGANMNASQKVY